MDMATMTPHLQRTRLQALEHDLEVQQKKNTDLITYFTRYVARLNDELDHEKQRRATELAHIIQALSSHEMHLLKEQQTIQRELAERDRQVARLVLEIQNMRRRYKDKAQLTKLCNMAQYCLSCRKHLNLVDSGGSDASADSTSLYDGNLLLGISNQGNFAEARRSKQYKSKRTSGTYSDYQKTRHRSDGDVTYLKSSFKEKNKCNDRRVAATTTTTSADGDEDDDDEHRRDDEEDLEAQQFQRHGSFRQSFTALTNYNTLENGTKEATTREAIHGVIVNNNNNNKNNNNNNSIYNSSQVSNDDEETNGDTTSNTMFELTDDWYASASDNDDSDFAVTKTYSSSGSNPVLECVNQILLQQSIDGMMYNTSKTPEEKAKDATFNRQRRVQFSTQNSMVQVPRIECTYKNETAMRLTPTHNNHQHHHQHQMQQQQQLQQQQQQQQQQHQQDKYESVYNNDYEIIGSDMNSSNHTYIDMEPKFLPDERKPHAAVRSKIPPALPPKPANLMKVGQVYRLANATNMQQQQQAIKKPTSASAVKVTQSEAGDTEPDYCSISEIDTSAVIKSCVQIVAEVHRDPIQDQPPPLPAAPAPTTTTTLTIQAATTKIPATIKTTNVMCVADKMSIGETDEIFNDVPKLPNVAAIIAPKKETLINYVAQDNYIIKPSAEKAIIKPLPAKRPSVLEQLKLAVPEITTPVPIKATPPVTPQKPMNNTPIKVFPDKMQIEAEFDWYNLDAEYGHTNRPDVIREQFDKKIITIEYNLDEEFTAANQPDIIK